jgi:hypothetical protein
LRHVNWMKMLAPVSSRIHLTLTDSSHGLCACLFHVT